MQRLKILIWHIHGSYLNTLARIEADWYLPVKPGRPEGYGGRGRTFDLPSYMREVPAERVRDLELDLIIYQTPKNYFEDQFEILSDEQRLLPKIYLDAIDPSIRYSGHIERGITVINGMQKRPRIAGYDIFQHAQHRTPLEAVGMGTEEFGGLGDVPYRDLHRRVAEYRYLFSPIRYTSLPLAVIEAMTIGMPVVALATTELPTVINNGVTGFISCDIDKLIDAMQFLLTNPDEARRIGENARVAAGVRFGLDRFIHDWQHAFALARSNTRYAHVG